MSVVLIALVTIPLVATLLSIVARFAIIATLSVLSAVSCLVLSLLLVVPATDQIVRAGSILRVDAMSEVFLLGVTFVYAVTSVYAAGYIPKQYDDRSDGADRTEFRRYSTRFYLGFNAFAWSLICAPLVDGLALLWVAIEITTVVSALLVALDATTEASEAAWKYVLIASSGLGIGLLATILMYFAGSQVLGGSYDLAFDPILHVGTTLPATPVRIAFLLAVVGYGTKVGFFPVHTWLPDAHAEAPTPVSALLSGSLLATSFYAILRFYEIATRALGMPFPRTVLLVFGILSLLVAALYLLEQRHLKRMLAYSSVEHMGILAIGVSFGAPLALAGVFLHVLAHAVAKANAFMGAGIIVQRYQTREILRIRNVLERLPWTGPLFLMAILALSAMPPFGLFRSEFQIVAGGLSGSRTIVTAALVVGVTVAFAGLVIATTRMLFLPSTFAHGDGMGGRHGIRIRERRGARAAQFTMVTPMVIGTVVLVVLGVYPPPDLHHLIVTAAGQIGGA